MRSYRNSLTWLLLVVFLFAQVIPVAAAGTTQYQDPNANAQLTAPTFVNNSGSAVGSATDQLANYYFTQYKNNMGWDWLKTTNINFSAFSGNTPQWNINTFQPLSLKGNLDNFLFAQGQYGTGNNTVNLGLGYRSMSTKHDSMYGFNLFYDWQTTVQGENGYNPTGSHMRVGAGLEYYTGSIETRLNGYYGVSGDVQVGAVNNGVAAYQHVAPGLDLSVGTDFSFWNAPWLKLTATGNYYAQTQGGTINGFNGSPLNANLTAQLQVTPQLSINGGGTFGNGGQSNANVGFQFNLLAPPQPALFLADPTVNQLAATDISYKMLQPVQRNNTITVERYLKQSNSSATGSLVVTILDSDGNPIQGADVSGGQTQVTAAVTTTTIPTAVTDVNGHATLTGVNLSIPVDIIATLGATVQTSTIAAGQVAPSPVAMPAYGNIAVDPGTVAAVMSTPGAKLTVYAQDGSKLAEYDPNAPGNKSGNLLLLRGLPPGASCSATLALPTGASVPLQEMQASTTPDVNSANVSTVPEATVTKIAEAGTAQGGVTAIVTYANGTTPLSGVTVTLTPNFEGGTTYTATTATNGVAAFAVTALGGYTLSFSDASIADTTITLSTSAPSYKHTFSSANIAPTTVGRITIGAITYTAAGAGELNNGANVILSDSAAGSSFVPRTAGYAQGRNIVFDRVPYGTYALTVSNPGSAAIAVATAAPLTLNASTTAIIAAGTIDGSKPAMRDVTVTFKANGAAVGAGTLVAAVQNLSSTSPPTVSPLGNNNVKVFKNLPDGTWYFGFADAKVGTATINGGWASNPVTISETTPTAFTIDGQYGTVVVTTTDPDGLPVANVPITIQESLSHASVTTGSTGTATINLWKSSLVPDSGTYHLDVQNGGYVGSVEVNADSDTAKPLPVTASTAVTVNGVVINAVTKEPVVGAAVTFSTTGGTTLSTTSVAGGVFSLAGSGLTPGVWTMEVSYAGFTTSTNPVMLVVGSNPQGNIALVRATATANVTVTPVAPTALPDGTFGALNAYSAATRTYMSLQNVTAVFANQPVGSTVSYSVTMNNDSGAVVATPGTATAYTVSSGTNNVSVNLDHVGIMNITKFCWMDGTELTPSELAANGAIVKYNSATLHTSTTLSEVLNRNNYLASGNYTMTLADSTGTAIFTDTGSAVIELKDNDDIAKVLYIQKNKPAANVNLTVNSIKGSNGNTATGLYQLRDASGSTVIKSGAINSYEALVITDIPAGTYSLWIGSWQGGTNASLDTHQFVPSKLDGADTIAINTNTTVTNAVYPEQTWTISKINYKNGTELAAGTMVQVGDRSYSYTTTGIIANNVVNGVARISTTISGTTAPTYSDEATISGPTTTAVMTIQGSPSPVPTGSISGAIYTQDQTPANGAWVGLYSSEGMADPVFVAETTANTSGAYSFTGLPAGTYLLYASNADAGGSYPAFPLADGQQKNSANITLIPFAVENFSVTSTGLATNVSGSIQIDKPEDPAFVKITLPLKTNETHQTNLPDGHYTTTITCPDGYRVQNNNITSFTIAAGSFVKGTITFVPTVSNYVNIQLTTGITGGSFEALAANVTGTSGSSVQFSADGKATILTQQAVGTEVSVDIELRNHSGDVVASLATQYFPVVSGSTYTTCDMPKLGKIDITAFANADSSAVDLSQLVTISYKPSQTSTATLLTTESLSSLLASKLYLPAGIYPMKTNTTNYAILTETGTPPALGVSDTLSGTLYIQNGAQPAEPPVAVPASAN